MVRTRTAVPALLLAGLIASGACAAPVNYVINFTVTGGSPTPTGSFTYDSAAALASRFTNFDVMWDALTFDFTSTANSAGSGDCGSLDSSVYFSILSGVSECPGTNTFGWQGENSTTSYFEFRDFTSSGEFVLLVSFTNLASSGDGAYGTWSIAINDAQTPEPSAFLLALTGGAFLMVRKRWAASRRDRRPQHGSHIRRPAGKETS